MPIAATGMYRQPYLAKLLLATSATFQTLVGAGSEAAALDSIACFETVVADLPIPRAMVERGRNTRERTAVGLPFLEHGGDVTIHLELYIPASEAAADTEDEDAYFMTKVGAIVAEMEARANLRTQIGGLDPLAVRGITVTGGPDRFTPDDLPHNDTAPEPNLKAWFVSLCLEL